MIGIFINLGRKNRNDFMYPNRKQCTMDGRLNLIVAELAQKAIVRQPGGFSLARGHAKGFARQRRGWNVSGHF